MIVYVGKCINQVEFSRNLQDLVHRTSLKSRADTDKIYTDGPVDRVSLSWGRRKQNFGIFSTEPEWNSKLMQLIFSRIDLSIQSLWVERDVNRSLEYTKSLILMSIQISYEHDLDSVFHASIPSMATGIPSVGTIFTGCVDLCELLEMKNRWNFLHLSSR